MKALKKYGMIILAEDSLGWQNRLIDKASVQFRLTAKNLGALKGSFFYVMKMTVKKEWQGLPIKKGKWLTKLRSFG